jgi:hypothetical protein
MTVLILFCSPCSFGWDGVSGKTDPEPARRKEGKGNVMPLFFTGARAANDSPICL